jgi:hypothetical protein
MTPACASKVAILPCCASKATMLAFDLFDGETAA